MSTAAAIDGRRLPAELVDAARHWVDYLYKEAPSTANSSSSGITMASPRLSTAGSPRRSAEQQIWMNELLRTFSELKQYVLAPADEENDEAVNDISIYLQGSPVIPKVVQHFAEISLEGRKDFSLIFSSLVRRNIGDIVSYLQTHSVILDTFMESFNVPEIALLMGQMLRECIKYPYLAYYILRCSNFWRIFDTYAHSPSFDIASEAFMCLQDLVTLPELEEVQQGFFDSQAPYFLQHFELLLNSENVLTRLRALKLLSELLLDRRRYELMMRYINNRDQLKTIMNLLRHKSAQITLETFHVFKIFVANPKKSYDVAAILYNNRQKLISFLEGFHAERAAAGGDTLFLQEKRLVMDTLAHMEDPALNPTAYPSVAPSPPALHRTVVGMGSGSGSGRSGQYPHVDGTLSLSGSSRSAMSSSSSSSARRRKSRAASAELQMHQQQALSSAAVASLMQSSGADGDSGYSGRGDELLFSSSRSSTSAMLSPMHSQTHQQQHNQQQYHHQQSPSQDVDSSSYPNNNSNDNSNNSSSGVNMHPPVQSPSSMSALLRDKHNLSLPPPLTTSDTPPQPPCAPPRPPTSTISPPHQHLHQHHHPQHSALQQAVEDVSEDFSDWSLASSLNPSPAKPADLMNSTTGSINSVSSAARESLLQQPSQQHNVSDE